MPWGGVPVEDPAGGMEVKGNPAVPTRTRAGDLPGRRVRRGHRWHGLAAFAEAVIRAGVGVEGRRPFAPTDATLPLSRESADILVSGSGALDPATRGRSG
eukprot:TRINITY_DN857_c0_g2_i1.p5 TRINITY_DN857_c0_g2~~TRINITY_DN857_c0_g2_i1.p5  ORF type:complete len:100 (-),score=17.00 TRINITY_DN857_c0_g2_i1:615-914(-)